MLRIQIELLINELFDQPASTDEERAKRDARIRRLQQTLKAVEFERLTAPRSPWLKGYVN